MSAIAFRQRLEKFRARRSRSTQERVYREHLLAMPPRQRNLALMRRLISESKDFPRKPDNSIRREKPAGWLLLYLLEIDDHLWGRWDYWTRTKLAGKLLDEPIPRITFTGDQETPARKMLEACLNCIPGHHEWRTWGSTQYMDYFLDWLLYGFGHTKELPKEPSEGAFSRLYQVFCLEAMLAWPQDYFGMLLAETRFGKGAGFFPTPTNLCEMMAAMLFGPGDNRAQAVHEPAVGTGRMLLAASNHSMVLSGQDILLTCVKSTIANLWLYAPWGAKPLSFLEKPHHHEPQRRNH